MDTSGIRQGDLRADSSSLLLGGRFQKSLCLRQQGVIQSWRGTDLATGGEVMVKLVPLDALQPKAVERMLQDDAVLRDLRNPWLSPPWTAAWRESSCSAWCPMLPREH